MNKIAAIQMASGPNVSGNLAEAARLIAECAQAGANMVLLPENFAHMGEHERDVLELAEAPGEGQIQDFLAEQAQKHQIWIIGGTIPLQAEDNDHVKAACLVFDDTGNQVARYDKMHLFDVEINESNEKYIESATISSGNQLGWCDTPLGRVGLSVCYDVRFPELFRELMQHDIQIFMVPSAFTATTGQAHWETLIRARAIENLSYVIAANQGGYHVNGRETFGDTMIVDPWGNILDRLPRGSGVVVAELDLTRLERVRESFPALSHRRINCGRTDD